MCKIPSHVHAQPVCWCVCMWVSLRALETPKTFQGPRVLLFKGLHYPPPPPPLCFHHMMFFLSQPFLLRSLLGSLCPFPSVSCPSTTLRPNNSRLSLPKGWTSSTSRLWQATVNKWLMLLLQGTGRNWLHGAGLHISQDKQMLRVSLYSAVVPNQQCIEYPCWFVLFCLFYLNRS